MNQIELYNDNPTEFDNVVYAEEVVQRTYEEGERIKWKRLAVVCAMANTVIVGVILGFACVMEFREASVMSFMGGIRFSWMLTFGVVYTSFVLWVLVLMLHKDKKLN